MNNYKNNQFFRDALFGGFLFLLITVFPSIGYSEDAYEPDDSYSQSTLYDLTTQLHNFHDPGDEDWIEIPYANKYQWFQIEVNGAGSKCDSVIELYDSDGVTLLDYQNSTGEGEDETLGWTSTKGSVYYARFRHSNANTYGENTEYQVEILYAVSYLGFIVGTVTDDQTGNPIGGARITSDSGNGSAISLQDGSYFMALFPGTYIFTIEADGYTTTAYPNVVCEESNTITLNFQLTAPPVDTDNDGVIDSQDNCPTTLNPSQEDIDGDNTGDVCDAFPNNKAEWYDNDGDLSGDNADLDDDNDGVPDTTELSGPNSGDANNDDIQDSLQNNVVSLASQTGLGYMVLESPPGTSLSNCQTADNPSPGDAPVGTSFDFGFFDFTINGLTPGGSTILFLTLSGVTPTTYYKYGQTPDNQVDHWYEFLYDGTTGAEINANVITLHFTDALKGDDVLTQDNKVIDLGAPGFKSTGDDSGGGGGGGGGCYISTMKE